MEAQSSKFMWALYFDHPDPGKNSSHSAFFYEVVFEGLELSMKYARDDVGSIAGMLPVEQSFVYLGPIWEMVGNGAEMGSKMRKNGMVLRRKWVRAHCETGEGNRRRKKW